MAQHLTQEGFQKIQKELNYLKKEKRKEIAETLKQAAAFGDLSENAAYEAAKEAQGFLESKISELEELINNAVIIKEVKTDQKVSFGSRVLVSSADGSQEFMVVGKTESDPMNGKISSDSPLGYALLNKIKGMDFEIETPQGKKKYKILEIK